MNSQRLPSAVYLRALFRYDPEAGRLYWRTRYDAAAGRNKRFVGRAAGCISEGRRRVKLPSGRTHAAARIVWKMVHGREPPTVDHIDGDPLNDRLANLRAATRTQNAQNQRGRSATGFKGVTATPDGKRWIAVIQVNGRPLHLGRYDDPAVAHAAYVAAAVKHFGKFARTDCAPARRRRRR